MYVYNPTVDNDWIGVNLGTMSTIEVNFILFCLKCSKTFESSGWLVFLEQTGTLKQ